MAADAATVEPFVKEEGKEERGNREDSCPRGIE